MKKVINLIVFSLIIVSCTQEKNNGNVMLLSKNPDEIYNSNYKPNLYEASDLVLDTIFSKENGDFRLKIRMREDLMSRNVIRTSQCNKKGYLTTYGNEFILEFFTIDDSKESLIGRNYVNIDLVRTMDSRRQIERRENLYSFEGVNHIDSKISNTIELNFGTIYAVGEGSNNLRISFDLTNTIDYCNIGGAIKMLVLDPYENY